MGRRIFRNAGEQENRSKTEKTGDRRSKEDQSDNQKSEKVKFDFF